MFEKILRKIEQAQELRLIKRYLSNDFRKIKLKKIENIPEFSDIILNYDHQFSARIVEKKTILLRLETKHGWVREWFSENYKWFLDTFYF